MTPLPELDHEREPGERQRERHPDPRADVLAAERARPDRDEQRAEVLDQERDADLEPVNREEVEELHERDAEDAEDGEPEQAAAIDAERARVSGRGRRARGRGTAPAQRASVRRSDESPDESATFATEPLRPKSVAALSTIA